MCPGEHYDDSTNADADLMISGTLVTFFHPLQTAAIYVQWRTTYSLRTLGFALGFATYARLKWWDINIEGHQRKNND